MTFESDGIYGPLLFLRAYNGLNIEAAKREKAVCKLLDVTPRTLKSWIDGARCPPRAAVIALWFESGDGLQVLDYDAHRKINVLIGLSDSLTRINTRLKSDKAALLKEVSELKRAQPGALRFAANDAVA